MTALHQNKSTGKWTPATPEPYAFGLISWAWKRLTGWRDAYGRKAKLFI